MLFEFKLKTRGNGFEHVRIHTTLELPDASHAQIFAVGLSFLKEKECRVNIKNTTVYAYYGPFN